MLQFVLSVNKTKSRLWLCLFPPVAYVTHCFLAGIFEIVPNYGVSFGCDLPLVRLVVVGLLIFILSKLLTGFAWGLYLILVGGLVNCVDRFLFGFVRDYFKVVFFYNNLADWIIFIGVVLYLVKLRYDTDRNSLRR